MNVWCDRSITCSAESAPDGSRFINIVTRWCLNSHLSHDIRSQCDVAPLLALYNIVFNTNVKLFWHCFRWVRRLHCKTLQETLNYCSRNKQYHHYIYQTFAEILPPVLKHLKYSVFSCSSQEIMNVRETTPVDLFHTFLASHVDSLDIHPSVFEQR